MVDIKSPPPPTNYGGVSDLGGRSPPGKILAPDRIFFESDQKLLHAPPNFKKSIALALLKAA